MYIYIHIYIYVCIYITILSNMPGFGWLNHVKPHSTDQVHHSFFYHHLGHDFGNLVLHIPDISRHSASPKWCNHQISKALIA